MPQSTTTTSSTSTTLGCPLSGYPGLRCALADGLAPPSCDGADLPRRVQRLFARAERLIDRAEVATSPAKARHRLRGAARLLESAAAASVRLGERGRITDSCASTLDLMLRDGQRRAKELALAP